MVILGDRKTGCLVENLIRKVAILPLCSESGPLTLEKKMDGGGQ